MRRTIQIKICGLTEAKTAAACVALEVDAIGLVFYTKSPRYVSDEQAAEIAAAVGGRAAVVGVFVDDPVDVVLEKSQQCGLTAVQLHGRETSADVTQLKNEGLTVIKALFKKENRPFRRSPFTTRRPFCSSAAGDGCRVAWPRHGIGREAKAITTKAPVILAGGLSPENVGRAVALGRPQAVDVSSGVEASPGKKDLAKIEAFVAAVAGIAPTGGDKKTRRIFQ